MRAACRWVTVAAVVVAAGCGTSSGGTTTSSAGPTSTTSTPMTETSSLASSAACRVERATIETADEAHKVMYGAYAESLDALAGAGLLASDVQFEFAWTYASDGETFTLTGPC